MDKSNVINNALAVRQGQLKLSSLPREEQALVRSALRSMTDAQLGRLAGARERRHLGERTTPARGLHDRPQAR